MPIVRALNTVNTALGFEAGFVIVIVAILLDRLLRVGDGQNEMTADPIVKFRNVDIIFGSEPEIGPAAARRGRGPATRFRKQPVRSWASPAASLDVHEGEIVVLMGLSGSGKSTLLRAVNGLNPVTRGEALVRSTTN